MGVLQCANPFILSVNMGINAGVVGVTFFGGSGLESCSNFASITVTAAQIQLG
jgi:hypothetical protein